MIQFICNIMLISWDAYWEESAEASDVIQHEGVFSFFQNTFWFVNQTTAFELDRKTENKT